jgi:hypothetical protein
MRLLFISSPLDHAILVLVATSRPHSAASVWLHRIRCPTALMLFVMDGLLTRAASLDRSALYF